MPRGTVLVTGGTGAIGGHVARWLAGRGARRSGAGQPVRPGRGWCGRAGRGLAAAGTGVERGRLRLAHGREVAGLLARVAAGGPPLTAVIHAAGVLDDGVLDALDPARLAAVLAAKAAARPPGRADRRP